MSWPTLNRSIFAAGATQTIHEIQPDRAVQGRADAALSARAVVAVTLLGAGFWYLLWKIALYFVAGH